MAVKSGPAMQGRKTHESKPTSKLSGQKYVTKPEVRDVGPHNYGVAQAVKMVSKMGGGK